MAQSGFKRSWAEFSETVNSVNKNTSHEHGPADINHLTKIGAHEELIATAKKNYTTEEFNIAPYHKDRKHTPDWMFKNSMSICGDGCGNFAIWMDVSRIDSPVLFVCHDPSEITVLARSPADFFDNLLAFLPTYNYKKDSGILYQYLQNWAPQCDDGTGLIHFTQKGKDFFDFNAAHVGDGVALDYLGKHTIVEEGDQVGILILATEAKDIIKNVKRRDQIWTLGFILALGLVFGFFFGVKNKSMTASVGWTFISLLMFIGVVQFTADAYFSWQDRKQK